VKILITNTVALNTGDAAIVLGLIRVLREAFGDSPEIVIYDARPDVAARYYPDLRWRQDGWAADAGWERLSWRLGRWAHRLLQIQIRTAAYLVGAGFSSGTRLVPRRLRIKLEDYASADLIIANGGTYLVEHYLISGRLLDLDISLAVSRPLILFTQSLGPFQNEHNQTRMRNIVERARLILLRDKQSLIHLQALGPRALNARITADAAFGIEPPGRHSASIPHTSLRVAISVREWKHFQSDPPASQVKYLEAIRDATVHLIRQHGAEIVFVSTCQGIPEYWADDSTTARRVYEMLPADVAPSVLVDASFHNPTTLLEILYGFDLVIATRMHMAILSLLAGAAVVPIAYEFKTQELFRNLGCSELVHDISTIDGAALITTLDHVIADLEAFRASLQSVVLHEQAKALSVVGDLRSIAGNNT
jgi:colanic acid/amylovoran biosynthesis protein